MSLPIPTPNPKYNQMSYALLVFCLTLVGCSSIQPKNEFDEKYADLPLAEDISELGLFNNLQRFEARYPIEAAKRGMNGCATVEYVISKDYQISNVRVLQKSANYFAKSAEQAVKKIKPKMANLPPLESPIKTKTRYEYCLENEPGACSFDNINQNTTCSGDDVITSIGSMVKRVEL